jgi:4-amino-4-deoxy-L-arabinose transferase-like glycosyltransferase
MSEARTLPGGGSGIRILLTIYLVLATLYSVVTPIFEASDEVWHYPMVRTLAQNGMALPVQTPGVETAWRQEGSQPPLYYMLAAALTAWIDTSDLDGVRRINPHADIGLVVPDGNANMTIHDPAARAFPWHGAALAVHLARLLSVVLGAVTVLMTYRLGRELFPESLTPNPSPSGRGEQNNRTAGSHWLALGAAALVAFNPMSLFISGSVNNDNLSNAVASALLVIIVRLLKRTDRPRLRELVLLGALAGAGMLAKFNIGFLLPVIGLALALLAWRLRDLRFFITASLITGGLTILIAGWWYVRNWTLYGDPTGLNVFIQIVGPRAIPANWAQLWSERHTFLMSYWGFFGGVNVPLPDWTYIVFNGIALVCFVGLVAAAARFAARRIRPDLALWLGRAVTVIWIGVLFAGLLRWTAETWASQGRLMFSAIAAISLWMAVGLGALGGLLPKRLRWGPLLLACAWFAGMAVLSLVVIHDAYDDPYQYETPPDPAWFEGQAITFTEPGADRPALRLGMSDITQRARPGEYVSFCLNFAVAPADAPFDRDWSLFVHLENPAGVIIAQRDVYLRQGQWATSLALGSGDSGRAWCNRVAVHLPDYAYAPQELRVYAGFYDLRARDRLLASAESGPLVDNRVALGTVQLEAREPGSPVPNPMRVDFGGEAALIGYSVGPDTLSVKPGDSLTVTLYWRALRPMATDYRVFVQIVEPNTTRVFGQSDAMPAAWARPTTTWATDEVIEDRHTITLNADAPPGIWQLVAGLYALEETPDGAAFRRLRIVTPDGGQAEDFISLTRLRIDGP